MYYFDDPDDPVFACRDQKVRFKRVSGERSISFVRDLCRLLFRMEASILVPRNIST